MNGVKNVSVSKDKTVVTITWQDGHQSRWDVILLRLYCKCRSCFQSSVNLSMLNDTMTIKSVTLDGFKPTEKNIKVSVDNDISETHAILIPADWLRKNCYCDECLSGVVANRATTFFDPKSTPLPTVDYSKIEGDRDAGLFECADKMMKIGFCVLKNVPQEEEMVLKVAEMFGPVHETVTNRMFNVRTQVGPRNTAHTALGLPFHQDLPWYETEPGVQFLNAHKFDADVIGGESQFVDLFQVAEILRKEDPESFADLARIPASYETKDFIRARPAHYETLKSHIEVDYFGNVVAVHWNPGVEGILRVQEEDVDKYYRGYNKFLRILRRSELEWLFRMDAGDVMIFNNHRMAHARKVYSSTNNGQRHLQGCYINLDDMRSTYVTLARKLGVTVTPQKVGNKSSF